MLFSLLIVRLLPVTLLGLLKDQRKIKVIFVLLCGLTGAGFLIAVSSIVVQEHLFSLIYIPFAMFPHYLCYIFSFSILAKCIWHAWSKRVWKRIYVIAQVAILLGIFAELCWNSKILNILLKVLK